MVDLNADGRNDVISGSFPGELYLFQRRSDGTFAAPNQLKGRDGKALNVGSAAHVFAVDWDGDGDLDLLVGNISGAVYLITNTGNRKKHVFAKPELLKAGGKLIDVSSAGIRFVFDERPQPAETVLIEARGENGHCFNLTAQVVWIESTDDDRFRVGCELRAELTESQRRLLEEIAAN